MALKLCEDCNKEISTMAISCPNCGRPNTGVVTIEQTQKKWKLWSLLGGFIMLLGFGSWGVMVTIEYITVKSLIAAFSLFAIGFVVWIGSHVARWYHHG